MVFQDWRGGVAAVPVPMILLDADCRVQVLNSASRKDVLLASVPIGGTVLEGANGSPELLAVAQARQRHFQQSLDAHRSLLFEDDVRLDPAFRWLCLPIMEENSPHLVVLGTTDDRSDTSPRVEAASSAEFVRLLHDEFRAPLASMVAMAATLSSKTTDDISARAKLINQTGRQILRRLNALLRLSEGEDVTNEH